MAQSAGGDCRQYGLAVFVLDHRVFGLGSEVNRAQ